MTDPKLAIPTAHGWLTLPVDVRTTWNPKGFGRDAIHAQILGRTSACSPILSSEVPRLLPALLEIGNWCDLQQSEGVHWQYAVTRLGRTCMELPSQDDRDACLIISDCDVSYGCSDNPERSLIAIELLQEFLEASHAAPDTVKKRCGWDPTGHELLELQVIIDDWEKQVAAW